MIKDNIFSLVYFELRFGYLNTHVKYFHQR